MMRWLRWSASIPLLILLGCVGDQDARVNPVQPVIVTVPQQPLAQPQDGKPLDNLKSEVQASSNATSNSLTGLGLQVAKVAEKVQGFGGDLAKITTCLQSTVEATSNLQATLASQVVVQSDMSAEIKASSQVVASLKAQLEAQVQAQVGLKNELQQTSQTIKAGHDATTLNVQFTKEMMDTLKASYQSQLEIVRSENHTRFWLAVVVLTAMCVVTALLLEASRRRAEARCAEERRRNKETGHA